MGRTNGRIGCVFSGGQTAWHRSKRMPYSCSAHLVLPKYAFLGQIVTRRRQRIRIRRYLEHVLKGLVLSPHHIPGARIAIISSDDSCQVLPSTQVLPPIQATAPWTIHRRCDARSDAFTSGAALFPRGVSDQGISLPSYILSESQTTMFSCVTLLLATNSNGFSEIRRSRTQSGYSRAKRPKNFLR